MRVSCFCLPPHLSTVLKAPGLVSLKNTTNINGLENSFHRAEKYRLLLLVHSRVSMLLDKQWASARVGESWSRVQARVDEGLHRRVVGEG